MARPDQSVARRKEMIPIIARTFADLGYRRTTTAELAKRCGVQETILYRLWPDKKAMFIAAIGLVYSLSLETWDALLAGRRAVPGAARRLLRYESTHHGEFGLYRLVFAGLSETDDPEIRAALRGMYGRFHRFVSQQIAKHRGSGAGRADVELSAWAVLGLGTVANIARELKLLSDSRRKQLIDRLGKRMLEKPT